MDVIPPGNLLLTFKNTPETPKSSSSDSESDTDPQVIEAAGSPKVRKYFQGVSRACEKDALISQLKDKISTLELSITTLESEQRLLYA